MRIKDQTGIILGGSAIALLVALGLVVYVHHSRAPVTDASTQITFEGQLDIPKIGVHAKIISVGRTPEGAMDTPRGPEDVGWYSLGTRPGEEGSAVMGGHRGWKNGTHAVFDDLGQLGKGDTVTLTETGGKTRTFVVRETRTYGKDDAPPEVFTSSGGVHLNLITCVGDWNADLKSTTGRLVVFTDQVSSSQLR